MDPTLRRIDEVLDDEELVDPVLDAMRGRFTQSARRGRKGTPAEVALRLLVLKHLKKWSYEELQWEVTGNLVYRHFCRIDGGKVPDAKTMVRLGQLLDGEVLSGLFARIVEQAAERRVTCAVARCASTRRSSKRRSGTRATRGSARTSRRFCVERSSARGPRG